MKRNFTGAYLFLLGVVALSLAAIYLKKSYYYSDEVEQKDNNSTTNIASVEQNSTNEKNKRVEIERLETTILEVKPSKYLVATEIADYENSKKMVAKSSQKKKIKITSKCKVDINLSKKVHKKVFHDGISRLAIIMDDIGNIHQANQLKNIRFAITPSIFPSTKRHLNTPKIAKSFKHYMVHLPMEAYKFNHIEENTLNTDDSLSIIKDRVKEVHKDFPNLIAINNHTGSKFTSSSKAMDRLFCALDEYKIRFIDSKTSAASVAKKIGELHNRVVYSRDIFLDNKPDVEYIVDQIQKAVKKAKKLGVAIAICHPRKETFEALREAEYLFEDIKLVYVDELY